MTENDIEILSNYPIEQNKRYNKSRERFLEEIRLIPEPWFSEEVQKISDLVNELSSIVRRGMSGMLRIEDIPAWIERFKEIQAAIMEIKLD